MKAIPNQKLFLHMDPLTPVKHVSNKTEVQYILEPEIFSPHPVLPPMKFPNSIAMDF